MTEREPDWQPASTSKTKDEADRLARATRFGLPLSIVGMFIWVAVIAAYFLLGVTESAPGDPLNPIAPGRFVLTFIVLAFGTFWGTILAGLGFALSLLALKRKTGPRRRAWLGIGIGALGVVPMFLTILEIARVSMR